MGLAASQGRLLLLTARKSDLELQAQRISQERLLLAIKQEQIANEYNDAINNQRWQVDASLIGNDRTGFEDLTGQLLAQLYGAGNIRDRRTNKAIQNLTSMSAQQVSAMYDAGFLAIMQNGAEISLSGNATFRQRYVEEDDQPAKAKYDAAMARVQRLDKQLELKLNQVETQHKAVETEIESVDKIIQNNIESSFKYFS